MKPISPGTGHYGDGKHNDGLSVEKRRERLAARGRMAREREEEATRQRLALLSSMSRTFAGTIRTTMAKRRRFMEERERLLKRERAARAEAEASRERMHEILESIGDAFFALDEEERFTYVNRKAEQLWGKRRGELLGRNIWKVFSQAIDSELYQSFEKAKEEGIVVEFEAVSSITGAWLSGRIYPAPGGFSVYFVDIEERKRADGERDRLLACERAARAEADAARREMTGILESITDAFATFDHDWRYTYINKAAREIIRATGRESENLLGKVLWEYYPEFVGTTIQTELLRAAREGAAAEFEEFYPPFDTWFKVRVYPSEGGVSVYFEDVTERKHAEQERERLRREAESGRARLEAILQQMPGGVFIADHSGRTILANEGATRIYRKQIHSIEECDQHTLSYPDGRELLPEEYTLTRALGGEYVSHEEYYVLRGDGTRGIISTNAAPVRDQEGRIVAAVKAFQDVTDLREAQEALEESEERLRTVVSNAPVVVFSLDREGVFTLSTGRGLEVLGLKPNELVGRSVFEVYADNPPILDDVRRALAGELFIESREVSDLIFEVGYAPIRDRSGDVVGVTGVATDVTERRKVEEERERFLAREWRARAEAEERKRISRELHDRVAHSMGVVHQSLELYEVFKKGKPSQAAAKMKLAREMTREALDLTRNISRELDNTEAGDGLSAALSNLLKTSVPPGLESSISVEGDESLIPPRVREQLFLILREAVRNAVSHSGAGRLGIEVKVIPDRVVGWVVGCVEDDGRGFEGAYEGNGDNGASGRGLHSMRERAELVGGALKLSSTPGMGTTIQASVPLNADRGGKEV
ncbi:MAG: PAS domain-containing protein [Rubrobacteraceae bacterium]